MNIIDGKEIAKKLREKIAEEVKTLERPPGLAVILVGEDPALQFMCVTRNLHVLKQASFQTKLLNQKTRPKSSY